LTGLLLNNKPENEEVMLKARRYLVTRQLDLDEKGKQDAPTDGGIGYGEEKATHADMSNTTFALEAIYYAQALLADKGDAAKNEPQLNFGAAIDFIQRCQNRPESNKSSWVSKDPKDAGGFIYNPTETRGAKVENPDGTISLRSYGSISYAGLLSFIYAGLDKKTPASKPSSTGSTPTTAPTKTPASAPRASTTTTTPSARPSASPRSTSSRPRTASSSTGVPTSPKSSSASKKATAPGPTPKAAGWKATPSSPPATSSWRWGAFIRRSEP
jgi:hypothetical protein